MKKSCITLCLIIILVILSSGVVFSADMLYRMLHTDDVESFKQDQDAFIIGEIIGNKNGNYLIKIYKVLSGKLKSDKIEVVAGFDYGWLGKNGAIPKLHDYAVMSLKKDGSKYKIDWGVFQTDSSDYITLKVIPHMSNESAIFDAVAIGWYINSGGKEKDFAFDHSEGIVYVQRDSENIEIYPNPKTEPVLNQSIVLGFYEGLLVRRLFFSLFFAAIMLFLIVGFVYRKRHSLK